MNLEVFKFENADLQIVHEQPGKIFLVMKPICDALSLDWHSQHRNISDDPVLNSIVRKIRTTGADGKQYEMICLPLDYLNGWLFKINANRYKGDRRDLIIRYQKECYRTLAERFGLSQPRPTAAATHVDISSQFDQVYIAVERAARREASMARYELACLAKRRGITDPSEFVQLAAEAMSQSSQSPVGCNNSKVPIGFPPAQYDAGSIHPATWARALDKLSQSHIG